MGPVEDTPRSPGHDSGARESRDLARPRLAHGLLRVTAMKPSSRWIPAAVAVLVSLAACSQPAPAIEPAPERVTRTERPIAEGPLVAATVVSIAKRPFVVLEFDVPKPSAGANLGPAELVESDGVAAVLRPVPNPPAPVASLAGRAVRLHGRDGVVCEGTLAPPQLLVRSEIDDPPATAEGVWESSGGITLVAELLTRGRCEGAAFARDAAFDPPTVAHASDPDVGTRARALTFVRETPAYRSIATRFVTEVAAPRAAHWDEHQHASPTARLFRTNGARYVWISMHAGEGCGEFGGSLDVLLRDDGASFQVVLERDDSPPHPVALLAEDGSPTLLLPEARLRHERGEWVLDDAPIVRFGCGC